MSPFKEGEPEEPLGRLFARARQQVASLEEGGGGPAAVAEALSTLKRARRAASRASLFSSNEEIEEVPTSSLRYLLLPSLESRALSAEPVDRNHPEVALASRLRAIEASSAFLLALGTLGVEGGDAREDAGSAGDAPAEGTKGYLRRRAEEAEEERACSGGGAGTSSASRAGDGGGSTGLAAALARSGSSLGLPGVSADALSGTAGASFAAPGGGVGGLGEARRLRALSNPLPADAAALREARLRGFRRKKELRALLREEAERRGRGAGASGGWEDQDESDGDEGGNGDAAGERARWLRILELEALEARERRESLAREVGMLKHASAVPLERRGEAAAPAPSADLVAQLREAIGKLGAQAGGAARPRPSGTRTVGGMPTGLPASVAGALAGDGGPGGPPLSLSAALRARPSGREARAAVLRPSHVGPALSVEEQGLVELRELREREMREARGRAAEEARRDALTRDQAEDEDLAKARGWDAWRDDHPRGYGNSKLKPTGR